MREKVWTTVKGGDIPLSKMDDNHLNNTINMLYRTAKKKAIDNIISYMSDEELQIFTRRKKLERILEEELVDLEYDIIWEKHVSPIYWDLVYEKKKRQKILFR